LERPVGFLAPSSLPYLLSSGNQRDIIADSADCSVACTELIKEFITGVRVYGHDELLVVYKFFTFEPRLIC